MPPQQIKIALRNSIWIEHGVGLVRRIGPARAQNAAIDDDMRDVNALPGRSSRAMLWASPRSANLPMANGADCG